MKAPAVSSAENVRRTGLCAGSDFTISYRSCVFFLHSSGAGITLEVYGELSERSKVRHSKCRVPKRNLGFESLTLRQKPSHIKAFAHMTGLFFSLKVTSAYMIFGKSSGAASRSAPAASPAPPAGNRPQCTAASWGAPPCRQGEGKQIHFDGVFQCLVDYFFSRHPNLGKLGLTKGRIYAIHE